MSRFAKVSAELIAADLTRNELKVALALLLHADGDGVCWPSADTIAEHAGIARNRVFVALRGLKAKGFVECLGGTRRRVTVPESGLVKKADQSEKLTSAESGPEESEKLTGERSTFRDGSVPESGPLTETIEQTKEETRGKATKKPTQDQVDRVFSAYRMAMTGHDFVSPPKDWVRALWAKAMQRHLDAGATVDDLAEAARLRGLRNLEAGDKRYHVTKPENVLAGGLALLDEQDDGAAPEDRHGNRIKKPPDYVWDEHDVRNLERGCVWVGGARPWAAPPADWRPNQ